MTNVWSHKHQKLIKLFSVFSLSSHSPVSEYIGGGELFDTIRKFSHKLVQLYVAEIAVALGNYLSRPIFSIIQLQLTDCD